ncbi:MAG: DUF4926 domain-containing protein [Microcoleaceae cyanobacterium]
MDKSTVMKAQVYDRIQTVIEIQIKFSQRSIPQGTIGTIVDCYQYPKESYSVDLTIPDSTVSGGFDYENIILSREQFIVVNNTPEAEQLKSTYRDIKYEVPKFENPQIPTINDFSDSSSIKFPKK